MKNKRCVTQQSKTIDKEYSFARTLKTLGGVQTVFNEQGIFILPISIVLPITLIMFSNRCYEWRTVWQMRKNDKF